MQLSADQRLEFEEQGYLIVRGVLDPQQDIAPVLAEYNAVLDCIATELHAEGHLSSTYHELPFEQRLIRISAESGRFDAQYFDFSLPQSNIRADTPIHVGPAVFGLLTNPRLLDVVESVVGPEISSNPVQHIRVKLPRQAIAPSHSNGLVAKVPWHQDNGVLMPEADDATILTVWIPLNVATVENGCLQVVPRSHRQDLLTHCPTDAGVAIPDRLVAEERSEALPMQPGDALLMFQRTVHSSLDNTTADQVRISVDLRYQPTGQATGRPAFTDAGFVARSAQYPETVLRDPALWAQRWYDLRERLADDTPAFNRWHADTPGCA